MSDWFPWYPALYQADTLHLTAAQDGIYRRLIDWYMTMRRPLPDNDLALAGIARVVPSEWADAAPSIRPFFKPEKSAKGVSQGVLRHKRCDMELDKQDKRSSKRGEVARKGAEARWGKINGLDASSMPQASVEHAEGMLPACLDDAEAMLSDATGQDKTEHKKEHPFGVQERAPAEPSPPEAKPPRKRDDRGTRLPDDWEPDDEAIAYANQRGLHGPWLGNEIEKFRNYWIAKSGNTALKRNWPATWRSWVITACERKGRTNGANGADHRSTAEIHTAAVVAAHHRRLGNGRADDRAIANRGGHGEADVDAAGLDDPGQADEAAAYVAATGDQRLLGGPRGG